MPCACEIIPALHWHIERNMSDFHVIKHNGFRFSAEEYNQLHVESLACIQKELSTSQGEQVAVFTHHCPTFLHYPAQYKGSILNEAFAVELFDLIEESTINYWVYGHHHTNTPTFAIGKTKLVTNQLGYVQRNEHNQFEANKYFEM